MASASIAVAAQNLRGQNGLKVENPEWPPVRILMRKRAAFPNNMIALFMLE